MTTYQSGSSMSSTNQQKFFSNEMGTTDIEIEMTETSGVGGCRDLTGYHYYCVTIKQSSTNGRKMQCQKMFMKDANHPNYHNEARDYYNSIVDFKTAKKILREANQ